MNFNRASACNACKRRYCGGKSVRPSVQCLALCLNERTYHHTFDDLLWASFYFLAPLLLQNSNWNPPVGALNTQRWEILQLSLFYLRNARDEPIVTSRPRPWPGPGQTFRWHKCWRVICLQQLTFLFLFTTKISQILLITHQTPKISSKFVCNFWVILTDKQIKANTTLLGGCNNPASQGHNSYSNSYAWHWMKLDVPSRIISDLMQSKVAAEPRV